MTQQQGGDERKRQRTKTVDLSDVPDSPETPEQCEQAMKWTAAAILTGKLDAVTGRAASDTYKALHAAMTARLGLEKRAKALEKKLAELAKERAE